MTNSWYDTANSAPSSRIVQTAADTCLLGNTSNGMPRDSPLYFKWGVGGTSFSPAFTASTSYMEFDLVDSVDIYQYVVFGMSQHPFATIGNVSYIQLQVGNSGFGDLDKRLSWYDVDNTLHSITFDAIPEGSTTTAYYQHTYRIELYDYLQQIGSDSVSRATFQWKLIEDGTLIYESYDGTTQLQDRLGLTAPTGSGDTRWCTMPRGYVNQYGYNFFAPNYIEIDNLNVSINGNISCVPIVLTYPYNWANITTMTPTSFAAVVTGSTSPLTYSIDSGALPSGLSLNTTTGLVYGTASMLAWGTSGTVAIKVVDANGDTDTSPTYTWYVT